MLQQRRLVCRATNVVVSAVEFATASEICDGKYTFVDVDVGVE